MLFAALVVPVEGGQAGGAHAVSHAAVQNGSRMGACSIHTHSVRNTVGERVITSFLLGCIGAGFAIVQYMTGKGEL